MSEVENPLTKLHQLTRTTEQQLCQNAGMIAKALAALGPCNLPMDYQVRKVAGKPRLQRRNKRCHEGVPYKHAFTVYPEIRVPIYDALCIAEDVEAGLIDQVVVELQTMQKAETVLAKAVARLKLM